MKEQDLIIGKTIYGWTDVQTEMNNWYDQFFNVWREKPRTKDEMHPTWSTSSYWAGELMYDMIQSGFQIMFESSRGNTHCLLDFTADHVWGMGDSIPSALADAIEVLSNYTRPSVHELQEIKQALERK